MVISIDEGFHVNLDGTPDRLSLLLDCYKCQLYFFSKKHLVTQGLSGYKLFLQDINICCIEDSAGRVIHAGTYDSVMKILGRQPKLWNDSVFVVRRSASEKVPLSEIEKILESGEKLIIETQSNRVPYFISFEGYDSPVSGKISSHVFLAIGHDGDSLLYVDFPYFVSNKHVQHNLYSDIGVARKCELKSAFSSKLAYSRVEVVENLLPYYCSDEFVDACLDRILNSYSGNSVILGEHTVSVGREAYKKIIEGLKSRSINLFSKSMPCDYYDVENLVTVMDWQFFEIKNRRKILYEALLSHHSPNHELNDLLDYAASTWTVLNNAVCVDPEIIDRDRVYQECIAYLEAAYEVDEILFEKMQVRERG